MKIFLTGGTGFIGSHFLRSPIAQQHEIVALRRSGSITCLPLSVEPQWLYKALDEVSTNDLTGCDVLVHLASPGVSPKKADWAELFYWNVTATLRLVDQARLAGVRRVVIAGTFAEYGRSADRYDYIPVTAPLEPTTAYAASKAAASVALSAYAIDKNMELVYLRVFSAYGEGQYESNFWPALRKAALAGEDFRMTLGEQIRDYIPVDQVAHKFWDAAVSLFIHSSDPCFMNVASGVPISMKDFATKCWREVNAKGELKLGALPYRENEIMRFVPAI